ncbi:DUF3304 domain-containing protein [Pseudomonas kunmingensis]|uniref:DUF3304 domain-containing protein n=1 Tax=Stutzerimonas stutzeri subgroup TaxID=578833 RepID=UPI000254936B|nr:DUF3304 domain-containing protein [Stutzerimonas stutzeri]EHY77085.1 hypothetical protein PstZobell_06558 [Stutzerimonas stutzeri ATCC 14405 = CCUG 16156]MBA1240605.1 DUF3304 domain-containing protein [Stutzerimonas kunmingensis]QOZ94051.1 DUF3304 domain-containing protein [Stutzerimonas stutzeri]
MILNSPHQKRWRRRRLVLCLAIVLLPLLALYLYGALRTPGAALTSHNYMERAVFSFWVNDFWGGNLAAMGAGGIMCCRSLGGSTAKVVWILSRTGEQARQGVKQERHEIEVPMPARKSGDDTLHVYFFPGNRIELVWASTMLSPLHYPDGIPNKPKNNEQGGQP